MQISDVGTGSKELHEWRRVRLGNKERDSDRVKWKGQSYVRRPQLTAAKETGLKGVFVVQTYN